VKKGIHPKYYPEAKVTCACGNTFITGSTVPELHTDVCSACHPFFTGEQRIVDTAGQVERFRRRLAKARIAQAQPAEETVEDTASTPTPGRGRRARARAVHAEEAFQVEEAPVAEEAPQVEEASQAEEASQGEEASQSE